MKSTRYLAFASPILAIFLACIAPEPTAEPKPAVEAGAAPEASAPPPPLSPEAELEQIETRLEAVKTQLFEQGKYNCCVKPSCDWCALHEGACDCFTNVQAGEAVCPGCGLGWHNGQGVMEGIDAGDVKWNITHEHPAGGHQH
jgi:hypothetical protein